MEINISLCANNYYNFVTLHSPCKPEITNILLTMVCYIYRAKRDNQPKAIKIPSKAYADKYYTLYIVYLLFIHS